MCDPNILSSTKSVLTYLLMNNLGSNTVDSLNEDFFNYVGLQIPYYELGYRFLETFFQSIPDTLLVEPVTKEVCLVYNPQYNGQSSLVKWNSTLFDNKFNHIPSFRSSLPISAAEHQTTNKAIRDLDKFANIDKPTSTVVSLPTLFEAQKSESTNGLSLENDLVKGSTVSDMNVLFSSGYEDVASSIHNSCFDDSSQCGNELRNPNKEDLSYNEVENDPVQLIGSKFMHKRYGTTLESINIESRMAVGTFYDLFISEVHSPYKFWFQFDDDSSQLNDLHEQLNTFYNNSSPEDSQDLIETRHMLRGQLCVAIFDQQWHRAQFIETPEGETVKVFFVDFGTVDTISINDVRYLLDCYCKLPKLCFRGTLDMIKPTSCRWLREATTYFNDLISNVKLNAGVSEINSETNSARIYVMDASKQINVNYLMVAEGHAFPDDPRERYKIHIADALPTFESLEKGEYPSFAEVGKNLAKGIDIEKMFESNIIDELACYTPQHMSDLEATELIQKYYRKKKMAKEIAWRKDATIFMILFGNLFNNPMFNGMNKKLQRKKTENVSDETSSSGNPFSYDDSSDH